MNENTGAKQQIIEKIKSSSNILVTVGQDPTVDELSAALGMTMLLNKLEKHATAVVSSNIPPAITFLEPEKTFEGTVDSLRDFIIALDKEKADHLRYKLEGDVVKIFITPYKTTITSDDLEFSQGDYNVEFVLALGVQDQEHLDKALEAHGRILHDASVAAISAGSSDSQLGTINWHESGASSISEMLTSLSEALKNDKPVIDEPIATAFLTGIVAATDRFSNNKTSSKVMTIAAQLMAAGANQQLIAAKLEESRVISGDDEPTDTNSDGTTALTEGESTKLDADESDKNKESSQKPDGSLAISHERKGTLDEVAKEVASDNQEAAAKVAEDELAKQLGTVAPAVQPADLEQDIETAARQDQPSRHFVETDSMRDDEPTLGGTLNATTQQAAEDKLREDRDSRNHTILTHNEGGHTDQTLPSFIETPFSSAMTPREPSAPSPLFESAPTSTAPTISPISSPEPSQPPVAPAMAEPSSIPEAPPALPQLPELGVPTPSETLADIDARNRGSNDGGNHTSALADVHAAFGGSPPLMVEPSAPPSYIATPNETPGFNPLPPSEPNVPALPPLPLPPTPPVFGAGLPPEQPLGQMFEPPATPPQANNSPPDPGQFKIPGQ